MKKERPQNKGNAQPSYISPDADLMSTDVQGILCQSGDIDDYSVLDDDSVNW